MQARYVILQVLLEVDGLVKITRVTASDGQPDLLLQLDRQKITTTGKAAIASFLQKLQVRGGATIICIHFIIDTCVMTNYLNTMAVFLKKFLFQIMECYTYFKY